MDEQTAEIQGLKAELKKLQAENEKLKPALKEAQENLVALENYTRRENLRSWISPKVEAKTVAEHLATEKFNSLWKDKHRQNTWDI